MDGVVLVSQFTPLRTMSLSSDASKVLALLAELKSGLRLKDKSLDNDVETLERVLRDPLFCAQLSQQDTTRPVDAAAADSAQLAEAANNLLVDELKQHLRLRQADKVVEEVRREVEPKVVEFASADRPLAFCALDVDASNPELPLVVVEAGEGAGRRIVVVGPRDLPDRPRIGGDSVGLADEILAIDRLVVAGGVGTTGDVRRHLRDRAAGCASEDRRLTAVVTVKRRSSDMVLTGDWTEVQVIQLTNDGSGLGFGIVGGRSTGVVVKTILPGSPADRDGRLRQGDHLLQIGHINLHGMSSQQVAMILRQQDASVRIVVGRPTSSTSPAPLTDASAASTSKTAAVPLNEDCITISTREALCAASLDEQLDAHQRATSPNPLPSTADDASAEAPSSSVAPVASLRKPSVDPEDGQSGETPERELRQSRENSDSERKGRTRPPRADGGLEDMALTSFCRENWLPNQIETVVVDLVRDDQLGLGITVAGYVHRKAEIAGVFVKSLVPGSSAEHTGRICVHDLILEVNGRLLEGLSHSESVRALVESGTQVRLKLIRFAEGSPQALCLAMLREQETETQVIDVQIPTSSAAVSNLPTAYSSHPSVAEQPADVRERWRTRLGSGVDVVTVELVADDSEDRLGLSLQGTVDVVDGTELCPHHYIDSIRLHGPAAISGRLKSGDELLQVNGVRLLGESHVTVRQALSKAAAGGRLLLTVARPSHAPPPANVYMPRREVGAPFHSSYCPVLSTADDRLVKAKSEVSLATPLETKDVLNAVARRLRSRSLQPLTGLAIWSSKPVIVQLEKTTKGLGFSVLDYQDPLHPSETVIVVRSLVPGGVAQQDGRIVPGDRLLFINNVDLSNATLAEAVSALKSAPLGIVHLGIAKPMPYEATAAGYSPPIISRSERVLAKGFSPRMNRRLIEPAFDLSDSESPRSSRRGGGGGLVGEARRRLYPQAYYPLTTSGGETPSSSGWHPSVGSSAINGSYLSMISWSPASSRSLSPAGSPSQLRGSWAYDVIYLPASLERSIMLQKGANSLGVNLDPGVDKGINGCLVKSISRTGAIGRDGRVKVGDLIVKVNTETLRGVTNSQARAILKRTNLIGTQCNITYIPAADAQQWREKIAKEPPASNDPNRGINRLSPKIFPKFYRSPYLDRKDTAPAENDKKMRPTVAPLNLHRQSSTDSDLPTTSHASTDRSCPSNLINGLAEIIVADDVVQAAVHDAFLEVILSEQIPDWTAVSSPRSTSIGQRRASGGISVGKSSPPRLNGQSSARALNVEAEVLIDQETTGTLATGEQPANISQKTVVVEKISGSSGKADKLSLNSSSESESIHASCSQHGTSTRSKFWGEARTVELIREPHRSFGISIVGGRVEVSHKGGLPGTGNTVSGIFIKSVLPNSPAGRCGQMNMGDRVISVNGVDLREATHEQAVDVIKNAKNPVRFVVQSLHSFSPHQMISSCSTSSASSPPGTPVSKAVPSSAYRDHSPGAGRADAADAPSSSPSTPPPSGDGALLDRRPSSPHKSELNDRRRVESVSESAVHETVEATVEQQPTGDRRQSITLPTTESTPEAQSPVRRNYIEPNEELRRPSLPQERSVAEPTETVGGGKMTQRERERRKIERNSAAALPWTEDDTEKEDEFFYTSKKIQNKYGELKGELLLIKLERPSGSLGLSLAGNRDRDKLSVFVVGVREDSPLLSASRPIRIGDELLEINGKVLFGLSHLNASSKIRECTDSKIRLVVLRRPDALEEMAVRPPEAALSRSQTEPAVHREKNAYPASPTATDHASARRQLSVELGEPRQVRIRKGSAGFGITIAEATTNGSSSGSILLITNVSPDAPVAEERSLKVGDQVLAVNGRSVKELSSSQVADMMQNAAQNELLLTVAARPVVTLPQSSAPASPAPIAPLTSSLDTDAKADRSSASPSLVTTGNNEVVRKKSSASHGLDKVSVEPGKETLLEIDKDGKGLGLSIVGGSDTVLGTVVIHEVYPDGAAAVDGRLKPGDQVLEVNGQSLRGVSHELAITALRKTPAKVRLLVYRDINLQLSLLDPTQIYNIFEIELIKKPGRGLGLSIVGRKNEPGVYVSEVVKGGAAEADNRLMQGDQILAVNGQDVTSSMQEDVAAMLKVCMGRVLLKVGRWKLSDGAKPPAPSSVLEPSSPSPQAHSPSPVASAASDGAVKAQPIFSVEGSKEEGTSPSPSGQEPPPPPAPSRPGQVSGAVPQVTVEMDEAAAVPRSDLSPVTEEPSSGDQKSLLGNEDEGAATISGPPSPAKSDRSDVEERVKILPNLVEEGCESLLIELNKLADQQLGMGIGKRSRGILITSLQPGSTAAEKLKVGDRIMAVNGQVVTDQVSAVSFVKASGQRLSLQIARLPDDPSNFKSHRRQIEVELIKDKNGFGFSIMGGEDTPDGLLPLVVKRVIEGGPAFDRLFVDDELVSINGQSLVGLSHSTAVDLIRQAIGPSLFVVVRAAADVV